MTFLTRLSLRRMRQATLGVAFLVVLFWGLLTYRADHHVFAWDRAVDIAVVALLDPIRPGERDRAERFVQSFLSRARARGGIVEIERWLATEYRKHGGILDQPVRLSVRGPLRLEVTPPAPPSSEDSFWDRYQGTRRFLSFYEELAQGPRLNLASYDATIFVYFYDIHDKGRRSLFLRRDSVASRRDRIGIVYAPISQDLIGHVCNLVAHEICHTLGASDKYDEGGSQFPHGFAEPERTPLYPQRLSEIMALGIPQKPGKDGLVEQLEDCVIGPRTAAEMNWTADDSPD